MNIRRLAILLAALLTAVPAFADGAGGGAGRVNVYVIDPARTSVRITWSYLGVPTSGATFSQVSGHIYGSRDEPEKSWTEAVIPVRTFKSGMAAIDKVLLNSGDFFRPGEYPVIRFRSTGIATVDKNKREFSMDGELTVNGITRPVVLFAKAGNTGPHPFYGGSQSASLNATTTFRRSDFGMGKYSGMVSDEMKVTLVVEAMEAGPDGRPLVAGSAPVP